MKCYLYTMQEARAGMINAPTPEEAAIVSEHLAFLQNRLETGELVLAGNCIADAFTAVIFQADSLEAAEAFMAEDPAIQHGLMQGDLRPFRISHLAPGLQDSDCS